MKIFIPIGSFYPNQKNGPSLSLYWLSKCLTNESLDVTIFTTNASIKNLEFNKVIPFDFGKVQYVNTKYHKFPLTLILKSIKYFSSFDFIIITSLFYPLSSILLLYSIFYNKKIIISPRGELYANALNSNNRLIKSIYIRTLNFILKLNAKNYHFHATSLEEKSTINNFFTPIIPVTIIPNYIYLPELQQKSFKRDYVLFLGRIHEDKALDKLVDAFSLIKDDPKYFNLKLILTGDLKSKYATDLIAYIKSKNIINYVEFVGFVDGELKSNLISNALCTILISNSENFGNSVLESLCFGTPVITSKGTPWSEVEIKNCGYWINNKPDLIKNKIIELVQMDDESYKIMCQNARNYAEQNFSIQKNKLVWLNLFKSL